ncbi:(Fe-S)-binding protein [Desulfotruncus alcoholivorax]|uniref:(Fe-S)-binding protein n=1 Tax=Desulfotruncus alcoholivorax TaxID=265477 RepID=UPI0003FA3061|nr:(Fe-S)-binding protein [Desulfotruncus alcoholivorax]
MGNLKFDPEICTGCETTDCLTRCRYLGYDGETARRERAKLNRGEDSPVLRDCVTCYACEEYCPRGNHPFYQLVDLQEQKGIHPVPVPFYEKMVRVFAPKGDFTPATITNTAVNLCLFPDLKPHLKGILFEDSTVLMSKDLFCNLIYLHFGVSSLINERVPGVLEKLAGCGIEELVCFHDECYALYASWAPAYGYDVPFRPVHLFRYLLDRLAENAPRIRKLGLQAAYQRPCSSRLTPEKEPLLDQLFDVVGVTRVLREYDRENALCCGAVFKMQGRKELAEDVNKRNLDDMVRAGAEVCIFNCPFCYMTMKDMISGRGLKPLLISDLCRMALGEEL